MSLLFQQTKKTPKFSLDGQCHIAKCVKCYDADSIHVVILLHGIYTKFNCRLIGIDTPEIRTKDLQEKEYAIQARDYLRNLVLDKLVIVTCGTFDKYGRLLINLYQYIDTKDTNDTKDTKDYNDSKDQKGGSITLDETVYNWENSINNKLVVDNYAYRYNGGTKKPFKEWYIA